MNVTRQFKKVIKTNCWGSAEGISRKGRKDRKEFNQIDFCPQILGKPSGRAERHGLTQIFARWLAVFVH